MWPSRASVFVLIGLVVIQGLVTGEGDKRMAVLRDQARREGSKRIKEQ